MNKVKWTDDQGYDHISLTKGKPEDGIRLDVANVNNLDWEQIKRELHNRLVSAELFNWEDVQSKPGLQGIIISSIKKHIIHEYKKVSKNYGE